MLHALEARAGDAIGGTNWAIRLDSELLANLGRYRKYNPGSLRDLLRVVRNKHNHFRELPEPLQQRLSPLPDGYLRHAPLPPSNLVSHAGSPWSHAGMPTVEDIKRLAFYPALECTHILTCTASPML